jgi:PAT family beta-lactamase induction signal transducer AmpG
LAVRGFPVIAEHKSARLGLIFLLYIAQGVPIGLFYIAIPAWLAANGASAGSVGLVLTATSLPWTLKFLNGFIMERFTYLPMGRRRAWVIGAQLALVVGLGLLAFVNPGPADVTVIAALAFGIQTATTFQDVAIDGMAVDLVPDSERERANGLMFGGQALGMAGAGAAAGALIGPLGLASVALLAGFFILCLIGLLLCCRERPGERLLPWSAGAASPQCEALQLEGFAPILSRTWRAMVTRPSLVLIGTLILVGTGYGFGSALDALLGTGPAGWDESRVSRLGATGNLIAGLLAVVAFGWLAEKVGARRLAILALLVWGALMFGMVGVANRWHEGWPVTGFILSWHSLDFLMIVCLAPLAMRLCVPEVSANQFCLYMACSNVGMSLASASVGTLVALGGLAAVLVAKATLLFAGAALISFAGKASAPRPAPFPAT